MSRGGHRFNSSGRDWGDWRVQTRNREPQNASISTRNALKQTKTLEMRDRTPKWSRPLLHDRCVIYKPTLQRHRKIYKIKHWREATTLLPATTEKKSLPNSWNSNWQEHVVSWEDRNSRYSRNVGFSRFELKPGDVVNVYTVGDLKVVFPLLGHPSIFTILNFECTCTKMFQESFKLFWNSTQQSTSLARSEKAEIERHRRDKVTGQLMYRF